MKKKTVLLVDKYPIMLESIKGLLKTVFDSVVMVSDTASLLETLPRLEPDLVVIDLSVRETPGVGIIRLINKLTPGVRVIVLTTYEESESMEKVMSSGASGYVLKCSAGKDLLTAVEEVCRGRTFVSSSFNI